MPFILDDLGRKTGISDGIIVVGTAISMTQKMHIYPNILLR
jgi:hypothetical protein